MSFAILSVVPTGEVDSITYRSPSLRNGMTARVAASTYEMSGSWLPLNGVGTTMKYASLTSGVVLAWRAPERTTSCSISSMPGSTMWRCPWFVISTTLGLMSTPVTCTPCLAAIIAVGRPI